jgi:hypothetical protein
MVCGAADEEQTAVLIAARRNPQPFRGQLINGVELTRNRIEEPHERFRDGLLTRLLRTTTLDALPAPWPMIGLPIKLQKSGNVRPVSRDKHAQFSREVCLARRFVA